MIPPAAKAAATSYSTALRRNEVYCVRLMRRVWELDVVSRYLHLAEHGTKAPMVPIRHDATDPPFNPKLPIVATVATPQIDAIETQVSKAAEAIADRYFAPMAKKAVIAASRYAKALGIPVTEHSPFVRAAMAQRKEAAIKLVENAGRAYAADVRAVFSQPGVFGLRVEDIRDMLLRRADVSVSRASLIARDQYLKTAAGITEAQHLESGIDSYTWSTSLDERVRPEHAALEGMTFRYDNPPEPGNPGEDYQCRCVALPIIEVPT